MDKIDFRHRAIIEAHAQLVRYVRIGAGMTCKQAAELAVKHGDALVEAMTVKHEKQHKDFCGVCGYPWDLDKGECSVNCLEKLK